MPLIPQNTVSSGPFFGDEVSVPASSGSAGNEGDWAQNDFYLFWHDGTQWYRITKNTF